MTVEYRTQPGTPAADAWETITNNYDSQKIVSKARDSRGFSEQVNCKMSPTLIDVMHHVVDQVDGYQSIQDLIRDAVYHRIHQIQQWPEDHPVFQPLEAELRQAEVDRITNNMAQWDALIDSLNTVLGTLIDNGDLDTAQHLLNQNVDHEYMTLPFQMKMGVMLRKHAEQMRYRMPQPDTGNHD